MKLIEEPTKVVRKGVTKAVSFGIKQTGLAHILNVLRTQLYSDKVGAVVRELDVRARLDQGLNDLHLIVDDGISEGGPHDGFRFIKVCPGIDEVTDCLKVPGSGRLVNADFRLSCGFRFR